MSFLLFRMVTSGTMPQCFLMLLYIHRAKAAFSVVIRILKPSPGTGAATPLSHTTAASSDSTQHSFIFSKRHNSFFTDDENDKKHTSCPTHGQRSNTCSVYARSTSATLHACAKQPLGISGSLPSNISEILPRQACCM